MRDPAHKIMEQQTAAPDKKDEKNMFCSEIHCEIYAALLHHNLPKIQKAAKSCKDGKGDPATTRAINAVYTHIARTRKGVAVVKWRRSVM